MHSKYSMLDFPWGFLLKTSKLALQCQLTVQKNYHSLIKNYVENEDRVNYFNIKNQQSKKI